MVPPIKIASCCMAVARIEEYCYRHLRGSDGWVSKSWERCISMWNSHRSIAGYDWGSPMTKRKPPCEECGPIKLSWGRAENFARRGSRGELSHLHCFHPYGCVWNWEACGCLNLYMFDGKMPKKLVRKLDSGWTLPVFPVGDLQGLPEWGPDTSCFLAGLRHQVVLRNHQTLQEVRWINNSIHPLLVQASIIC